MERNITKKKALELIDKKLDEFKSLHVEMVDALRDYFFTRDKLDEKEKSALNYRLAADSWRFQSRYDSLYQTTISLITKITTIADANEFERKVKESTETPNLPGKHWLLRLAADIGQLLALVISNGCTGLEVKIKACEKALEDYGTKVNDTLPDDPEYPSLQIVMGHQVNIGDFTDISGSIQILVGNYNKMVNGLDDTGQTELAHALQILITAVLASKDLFEDKKRDLVSIINQIGEEAKKPKPNKTLLKMLIDGLIASLKAVPDMTQSVTAAAPLLSEVHL